MKALVRYDPLDAATLADPYPVYAALREQAPVWWHEGMRCWVLTRYADCLTVMRDHRSFARDWRRAGESTAAAGASIQSLDPPEQTPVRSLFLRAVHAEDLDLLSGRAREVATELLDELADRDRFDLVGEFAAPYALRQSGSPGQRGGHSSRATTAAVSVQPHPVVLGIQSDSLQTLRS